MNILVIGNGFDLAHGLPTKYTDFLEWVKAEYGLYTKLRESNDDIVVGANIRVDWAIVTYPSQISVEVLEQREVQKELWECMSDNIWIDYFLNNSAYIKDNWIDFECEISKIIRSIDCDRDEIELDEEIYVLSNEFLCRKFLYKDCSSLFEDMNGKEGISFQVLLDKLYHDLNRLIRLLEIYLEVYVEEIDCVKISPDLKNMHFDGVLSFNYTDTYRRVYGYRGRTNYDFIHGQADINNSIYTNNMVLGIDEYLSDDRKDSDVTFIAFKKFFQRIYKCTGSEYIEWINKINVERVIRNYEYVGEDEDGMETWELQPAFEHNLYIFGHSLDITDKDVLKKLIMNDRVKTTIFYNKISDEHGKTDGGKKSLAMKITNLVKVIGQDELIRKTGGSHKTIEFKLQQDMVDINE